MNNADPAGLAQQNLESDSVGKTDPAHPETTVLEDIIKSGTGQKKTRLMQCCSGTLTHHPNVISNRYLMQSLMHLAQKQFVRNEHI